MKDTETANNSKTKNICLQYKKRLSVFLDTEGK